MAEETVENPNPENKLLTEITTLMGKGKKQVEIEDLTFKLQTLKEDAAIQVSTYSVGENKKLEIEKKKLETQQSRLVATAQTDIVNIIKKGSDLKSITSNIDTVLDKVESTAAKLKEIDEKIAENTAIASRFENLSSYLSGELSTEEYITKELETREI